MYLLDNDEKYDMFGIWEVTPEKLVLYYQQVNGDSQYIDNISYEDLATWKNFKHYDSSIYSVLTKDEADAFIFMSKL